MFNSSRIVEIKNRKKFVSKKWKKLVLKPIIFNFESIETNFCFEIFLYFFVDVKKNEKSVSKKMEKVSLKINYFRFGVD